MTAFTQRYKVEKTATGFIFTFYCDLCEHGVTPPEIATQVFDVAFERAQKYARPYFNMCHKCGRWICDEHYNVDKMACVLCEPEAGRL